MKTKYKEFAKKFEKLCDEYMYEDFNADELLKICEDMIQNYSE